MVGGVAARAAHTFGVVIEASAGVDEDEHRGRAAVRSGELVDHSNGVASAYPVGWITEFTGDHHHRGQFGRDVPREPDRRQVDELPPVLEPASAVRDVDRLPTCRYQD